MRIALAGNPNSGKTTMFNALTGKSEKVGNWAGVTVDKKEGTIKRAFCDRGSRLIAVDLPGAYSMSPYTTEESITSSYVREENPDVIVNIVDATNLSRSLFFTTQLLELGIPVVVALNKSDVLEKEGTQIHVELLAEKLKCPVIQTVSTAAGHPGLREVVERAVRLAGGGQTAPFLSEEPAPCNREEAETADRKRFEFVKAVVSEVENHCTGEARDMLEKRKQKQDRADALLTNPCFGIPIFAVILAGVFYLSYSTVGTWIADWLTNCIDTFRGWVAGMVENGDPFLQALLLDGVIGGVGAVVGFLPLVMIMYFLIALLEDCGYMARASVVLDPIFKRVGLSGKSVIPMVVGTGCAIPGIMACRTIRSDRERRLTAMLTPFMPCGAKLPVIALFVGAFFPDAPWMGVLMYFAGAVMILFGAFLVNVITGYRYRKSFFIIELPDYKLPSIKLALTSMLSRGRDYIVKAGTIILICNTVVQMMQSFTWSLKEVEEGMEHTSILAGVSMPIAYLLVPIVGVVSWQLAAAAVSGLIAKENVVGTLAVCYGLKAFIDTEELTLVGDGTAIASAMGLSRAAALAYLMFVLFSPPCFAALGAMNSELQSRRWFWGGVALMLGIGYGTSVLVYQIGTLFTAGNGTKLVNVVIVGVLLMVCALAGRFLWKEKKKGRRCMGCPAAGQCGKYCGKTDAGMCKKD